MPFYSELQKYLLMLVIFIYRRFARNIFCSENDHLKHLNSCGKLIAISDLTVVPIDSSNLAQILHIMGQVDGVFNGRNKSGNGNCKKKDDPRLTLEGDIIYRLFVIK